MKLELPAGVDVEIKASRQTGRRRLRLREDVDGV